MEMAIREVIVTPEMAKQLLDKNTHNRALSQGTVARLVGAMNRGEWQYNGDTIRLSKSGRLLDGQHRLAAIERSGLSQKYIIVDGLDDESFTTIDVGKGRTAGDMLSVAGEKNTNILAAVSKMDILLLAFGRPEHGTSGKNPTHTEIVNHAESNQLMKQSVSFVVGAKWLKRMTGPSVSAFCHYRFSIDNELACSDFFSQLVTGEFSYKDSPVKYMRDFFLEECNASAKTPTIKRIAMMFHAYRAFREGKSVRLMRLPKDQNEWFKL